MTLPLGNKRQNDLIAISKTLGESMDEDKVLPTDTYLSSLMRLHWIRRTIPKSRARNTASRKRSSTIRSMQR